MLVELEIADVIAGVDASMFVLDFVPNATVEQMKERADKFYTIIRSKHPDTPVLFVEDPLFPTLHVASKNGKRHSMSHSCPLPPWQSWCQKESG